MSSEQWDLLRQATLLIQWNNGKRATTASFPIDRKVLWVDLVRSQYVAWYTSGRTALYLYQVGIPGIATNVQVIVSGLLPGWLSKDVSYIVPLA